MTSIVRGSKVFFSAVCTDAAGAAVTPDSANLYLRYVEPDGTRGFETIAMTVNASTVTAEWDSSVASDGLVHWSIRTAGSDKIAQDGEITLTANESNPA